MKLLRRIMRFITEQVGGFLKKHWAVILSVVITVTLGVWVVYGVYIQGKGWANWTGFTQYETTNISTTSGTTTTTITQIPARTLWDWLELLIVPFALGLVAWWLNKTEKENEHEIAERRAEIEHELALDRQREATLQSYYDRMTELLLDKKLRSSEEVDEIRDIARVQTLTTLRSLDDKRKGYLLQFLREACLIENSSPIIRLQGADLRGADLAMIYLVETNLMGADLMRADLSETILARADLARVNLM